MLNPTGFEGMKLDSDLQQLYFKPIPACRAKDTLPLNAWKPNA